MTGAPDRSSALPRFAAAAVAIALSLLGCGETRDSLGYDERRFDPLQGPGTYPNVLREVLGLSDGEITARLNFMFDSLFYGTGPSTTKPIYVVDSENDQRAYIKDDYNMELIHTEGNGLAMMVCVQFEKPAEFESIWRYVQGALLYKDGPSRGYFKSWCSDAEARFERPCADPYGHQQIAMALLFAANKWGRADYLEAARAAFDVMRRKELENGGVVDGVTSMFDEDTKLVYDAPDVSAQSRSLTRPSIETPAYSELWYQGTKDPFWLEAARAARAHVRASTDALTGLVPVRSYFSGEPVPGYGDFIAESYRTQLNTVLDYLWFARDPRQVEATNRLLTFFVGEGLDDYVGSYTLAGAKIPRFGDRREPALIVTNGISAAISTIPERKEFIEAFWDASMPRQSPNAYYHGMLDLVGLLMLSGRFRVY